MRFVALHLLLFVSLTLAVMALADRLSGDPTSRRR